MKKGLFVIFTVILLIPLIQAQAEITNDPFAKSILDGTEKLKNISEQEDKEAYLSQEWTKLLQKNKAFSWIYKLNPIFKFMFGYEFSLSWAFLTALLLWIIILSIFFPMAQTIFRSTLFSLGVSIPITIITAQLTIPKSIEMLTKITKNIWWGFGVTIGLIFLIVLIGIVSKDIIKIIAKRREQRRIQNLESEASKSKATREGFESIQGKAEAMKKGYDKYKK